MHMSKSSALKMMTMMMMMLMILSTGSKVGSICPRISSKLYWNSVILSLLYEAEVMSLEEKALDMLE